MFGRGDIEGGEEELKYVSNELTVVLVCQYCTAGLLIILHSVRFCCLPKLARAAVLFTEGQKVLEDTNGTFNCGNHSVQLTVFKKIPIVFSSSQLRVFPNLLCSADCLTAF